MSIFKEFLAGTGMGAAASKIALTFLDPLKRGRNPLVNYEGKPIRQVAPRKFLGRVFDADRTCVSH